MKSMWLWIAVLLAGILVLVAKPFLFGAEPPLDSGFFPEWITPVGYFLAVIGAGGIFYAWARRHG